MEVEVRLKTVTGQGGAIRWGYAPAVVCMSWTMTRCSDGKSWALGATVSSADEYRITQRPLVFVAANGWQWPVLELQITGASLTGLLGPKEQ